MERVRIQYAKTEPLRYTGNLDIHKVWERTLRRFACNGLQPGFSSSAAFDPGLSFTPRRDQPCRSNRRMAR